MNQRVLDRFQGVAKLLAPIGADQFYGTDIGGLLTDGVPGLPPHRRTRVAGICFDRHYTQPDTVDSDQAGGVEGACPSSQTVDVRCPPR